MTELVSILIPCYNAERWLKQTIESVLSQTWANKEIIIVDDGSTDNSLQIAKQYESAIVKVVSQENKGACAARNKALEYAQGDYIQWLDADDLLAPDKIEKQLSSIGGDRNSRTLLTSSWGYFYYRHEKAKFKPNNLWRDLGPVEWLMTKFNEDVWMNPSVWLVSRTLTELAGPWDIRSSPDDDGEYICRVVMNCEKVKFVKSATSYYRISNPWSLAKDRSKKAVEGAFFSYILCITYLRSLENSERTKAACLKFLQSNLYKAWPEHTILLKKCNEIAEGLGGELSPPALRWELRLAKLVLGISLVKRLRRLISIIRTLTIGKWDKLFYDLSKHK